MMVHPTTPLSRLASPPAPPSSPLPPLPPLPRGTRKPKTLRRSPPVPIVPPPREWDLQGVQLSPGPLPTIINCDIYINLLGHEAILVLGDGEGFRGPPKNYFPTRQCRVTVYGGRVLPLGSEASGASAAHIHMEAARPESWEESTSPVLPKSGAMTTPRMAQVPETRSAVTPPDAAATNWDWLQTDPTERTYRRKARAPRTPTSHAAPPPRVASRSYPNLRPSAVGVQDTTFIDFTPDMFIPSRPAPLPPTGRRSPSAAASFGQLSRTAASAAGHYAHTRPASPAGTPRRGVSSTIKALAGAAHVGLGAAIPPSGASSTGLRTSKSLHNLGHRAVADPPRPANFLATPTSPPYASLTSASIQLHQASSHRAEHAQPAASWSPAPASLSVHRPHTPTLGRPPYRRTVRGDSSSSSYSPSPASEETTGTGQSVWTDPPSPELGWTEPSFLPSRKPTRWQ